MIIFNFKQLSAILEAHEGKTPNRGAVYAMLREPFKRNHAARLAAALEAHRERFLEEKRDEAKTKEGEIILQVAKFERLLNDLKTAQPTPKKQPEKLARINGEVVRFDHCTKFFIRKPEMVYLGKGELLTNPYVHQIDSKSEMLRRRARRFQVGEQAFFWKIKK